MMARSIGLALAIAGLVACAAITTVRSAGEAGAAPPPCTPAWSEPQQLRFGRGLVYVESPQIVATRAGIALLGDNALAAEPTDSGFMPVVGWPRGRTGMLAGMLLRSDGTLDPIPIPSGVRAFIGVRAVSHNGVAHVFWGGSADTSADQSSHLNGLWYSQFDGKRWTPPEHVVEDTTIMWSIQLNAITLAGGQAHVTALLKGPIGGGRVLHVVRDRAGQGSVSRLDFDALYTHLAAYPDGTLLLAMIHGSRANRAQITVRRSQDRGRSWSEPSVVFSSGLGTAFDPRLVVATDGSLYVTWLAEPAGVARTDSILVARSRDRGLSWERLPGLGVAPDARDLWAVAGPNGSVHIAYYWSGGEGGIAGARLLDGAWHDTFARGPTPFAPILAAITPESLYLAWDVWSHGGPERMPTKMLSRRVSCPDRTTKR